MLIIGDVHGKTSRYHDIVKGADRSIQVGDFGFEHEHRWHLANIDPEKHKVVFGNHDFYPLVNAPHSLGDFAVLDGGIMTIRGAKTLDKSGMKDVLIMKKDGTPQLDDDGNVMMRKEFYRRTEGVDIFEFDEQLSRQRSYDVLDAFIHNKPSVVITHDCPTVVRQEIMDRLERPILNKTSTDQLLQGCFQQHQPKLWLFGHYHVNLQIDMEGTRFVCLAELQTFHL